MKLQSLTMEQLLELRVQIEKAPENQNRDGFYLYTKSAIAKLDKIDRQIQFLIGEKRKEAGLPINNAGYSGRKSNKRR